MPTVSIKQTLSTLFHGLLNSYTQIFFSKQKWFAVLVIIASFIDPVIGIGGMIAVMITNIFALIVGYNRNYIYEGIYGFNSLLVGFGMGMYFEINFPFFLLLSFAAILTFLITVWLLGKFSFFGLPIGSISFVVVMWIVILATRQYHEMELSTRGIYIANELWKVGGENLVNAYQIMSDISLPKSIEVYLKSLGAIIFQYNLLAGIIIAVALLFFSRIAFTLSLLGFYSGWFFYKIIGGNLADLQYGYIGFNFILTAIAIGGYFLIPSINSYLLVIILTPLNAMLIAALSKVFQPYQLSVLSLPFNIVLLLILYGLKLRSYSKYLQPVFVQYHSPEQNLYHYQNSIERFSKNTFIKMALPFYGEWNISQGHHGNITHKGDWACAWDFVIKDNMDTYHLPVKNVDDFYCFKKPVLSPADGWIHEVIDHIEDNNVGEVNLQHNWGNTIIIKHAEGLYSKLSHLMQYSILYPKNTFVKKGDVIGYCGNSGRSPEPHIHFQIQTTPYIDSKTLDFPVAYYISKKEKEYQFHAFDRPQEEDVVSNVFVCKLLHDAFRFELGSIHLFAFEGKGEKQYAKWEVMVDIYNATYLYCHNSKSKAYFVNDGTLFYFTSYIGNKNSLLYYFYLAAYNVLLGYYQDMEVSDNFPLSTFNAFTFQWIEDFISPFYSLKKSTYKNKFRTIDDLLNPQQIVMSSEAKVLLKNQTIKQLSFAIIISPKGIQALKVSRNNKDMISAERTIEHG